MIQQTLTRFARNRRGAVMVIFALALVPLVLMVALAIDYSFYAEARSQIQLAADAAATHAVRTATGTYSAELNQTTPNPTIPPATAQSDAVAAGQKAGREWFQAQLGQLVTASVPGDGITGTLPTVTVTPTTNPSGFSATVQYLGFYPPFFNGLFQRSTPWAITGTSGAQAQYSYVQIMMMLDTSQSMLIGADQSDILAMSENSVCLSQAEITMPAQNYVDPQGQPLPFGGQGPMYQGALLTYSYSTTDGDQVPFSAAQTPHYTPGGADGTQGTCAVGYRQPNYYSANNPGYAGAPCAFACHYSNTIVGGYSQDLYGVARQITPAIKLRLDVVLSATEQVISSMISNEQASNQYSIGLYQFNTDVSVLTAGTQGSTANGDNSQEATFNLSGVLQDVYNIDWAHNPTITTTSFPKFDDVDNGNTNFPTSMNDFYKGKATGEASGLSAVLNNATNTPGYTQTNPLKDLFIVTDGQEDECCGNTRVMGEMTGVNAENGHSINPAICQQFKNLGYTIYVLYIYYYPVPTVSYYVAGYGSPTDKYINEDYGFSGQTTSERTMTVAASTTGIAPVNASFPGDSPNVSALRACASTNPTGGTTNPTYFYQATSSQDISTAMAAMLANALSNGIRISQ